MAPASISQVYIYFDSASLDCVENVQHLEHFDEDHPEWYPISTAHLWDSVQGANYKILVRGRAGELSGASDNGSFELTVVEHERPENDACSVATDLDVGQKLSGATNFATLDEELVCSPETEGEATTAPGVWYKVVSQQTGRLQVSVESGYGSQITVFEGNHCDALLCVKGTNNTPPDTTALTGILSSEVQWDGEKDKVYYVLVHGSESMVGLFDITMSSIISVSEVETPAAATPELATQAPESSAKPGQETDSATTTVWDVQTTASLAFGFFPGANLKSPSKNDIEALMGQVSSFFSKEFQGVFDDAFIRFEATAYDTAFDDQTSLPIVISFAAKAYFTSEETAATVEDMFGLMAGADFQKFIRSYAWQTEPFGETLFFQTLRVSFGEARSPPTNDQVGQSDGSQEEAVQRVTANAKMQFSFFPDTQMREPTKAEVNGLVKQARFFFTKVFESQFDDFVRFGAVASATNYTEGGTLPITLSLDVSAFFGLKDGNGNANNNNDDHTPEEVVAAMKNAQLTDFIQNYVWASEPFSENIFYETMHVQVMLDDKVDATTDLALLNSLHVVNTPSQAVVHVALSYSFHDTATVTLHEPTPEEIDGLFNTTADFFSQVLLDELPDSSSIDTINLVSNSVDYKEQSEYSIVVYARLEVGFIGGSDPSLRPTAEQMLALRKWIMAYAAGGSKF